MKLKIVALIFVFFSVWNCSLHRPVTTAPSEKRSTVRDVYVPVPEDPDETIYQKGVASWYGGDFNGKRTSNGEIYDMFKLTAAHKELPFNTIVEVENLRNGKKVIVRINDRGPFIKERIIDLSYKAAIALEMDWAGTAPVIIRVVNLLNNEKGERTVIRKLNFSHRSEYFLQAGAFSGIGNARSLIDDLEAASRALRFEIIEEGGLFKVISEKIGSREEAEKLKMTLENNGFETFIKEVFFTGEKN